jgi:hypothetical protein
MRFTKLLFVAGIATVFATPAFAQGAVATPKVEKKAEKKAEKKENKAAKKAEKKEESAEHRAFDTANGAPKKWLAGVPKITKAERTQLTTVEKKYSTQLSTLKKDYLASEKAGTPDAQITTKVQTIVDQERAEIRAALTADQQTRFDANVSKKKS